ncbi:MAG TPA: hypothetical protein PLO65_05600 [Caulobacter sp.]|nr:hypothetical protein [Caulobacter sp.]
MKSLITAAVVAASLAAAPAWAADFQPAPNADYVLDLDTPDDSFSLWRQSDLSGISAARAQVTFRRVGRKKAFSPGASIILANDQSEARLSFVVAPKGAVAILIASRGETKLGSELFVMPVEPGETFGLELDWTPEGKVVVRMATRAVKTLGGDGFERHEITMAGAPTRMEIVGVAAEIELKPLTLGSVR